MLLRLANLLEALFVLFLGTALIYLLRHFLILGCCLGMLVCLIGLNVIGRIQRARRRKLEKVPVPPEAHSVLTIPEGATLTTAVGTAGESVLLRIVKGATGPIGEAVRSSLVSPPSSGISDAAGIAKGPTPPHEGLIGPTGPMGTGPVN
jgi:hypothetical protein